MDTIRNIHPGEVLKEEFLVPLGVSQYRLAKTIGVPAMRISEICAGKRAVSADTALRLGLFFEMDPRFWMNLQTEFDMRMATRELKDKIAPRVRVFHHPVAP